MGRREAEGQRSLPFAEAAASMAERRSTLGMALARVQCDCRLSVFVQWVFRITGGGLEGELVRSYEQLRQAPWGLCCTHRQARETVAKARRLGLVAIAENRYTSGGQRANGYTIDWPGIRRLLAPGHRVEARPSGPGGPTGHPHALTDHPHALTDHPHALTDHPYKEIPALNLLQDPDPGPETGPGPGIGIRTRCVDAPSEGQDDRSSPRMATSTQDPPCSRRDAAVRVQEAPHPRRDVASDALRLDMLESIPELIAARGRPVEPLPATSLLYSVFKPLEERHLGDLCAMTRWFRRQLSAREPVALATEADLLLVLAAAVHARKLPERDVQKNRVAVFAVVVGRGRWYDAAPHVDEAHRRLDAILERFGRKTVLLGEEAVYPKRKPKPEEDESCSRS